MALSSDVLFASALPLVIFLVIIKLSPSVLTWAEFVELVSPRPRKAKERPFSLQRAYQAYLHYPQLAKSELSRMHASFSTLGRTQKRLGYNIGYTKKLEKAQELIDVNARITTAISGLARMEFTDELNVAGGGGVTDVGLGRVRESLKHFVRDWSEEGKEEREKILVPILSLLREVDEKSEKTVLVPGAGLGRLAWEISQLGFDTTANELSFYPNLAFRFLLSPTTTTFRNQHILHPYSHWFSHQRTNISLFRGIPFPDVVPRLSPNFRLSETDFLSLKLPPSPQDAADSFWLSSLPSRTNLAGYNYIVTLFFIDTSLDILSTLAHIYYLLRPGGTWVNLGPLLWTGGAQTKIELNLEEVLSAAESIGFIIEGEGEKNKSRTVECEYTGDRDAMMKWIYEAEFWVARKPK